MPKVTVPSASKFDDPMSILPKPEVMEPEFKAPVVVRFESVSIAVSIVVSVVASIASMLFRDAVSPPEKILVEPRIMSPPPTVRSPPASIEVVAV